MYNILKLILKIIIFALILLGIYKLGVYLLNFIGDKGQDLKVNIENKVDDVKTNIENKVDNVKTNISTNLEKNDYLNFESNSKGDSLTTTPNSSNYVNNKANNSNKKIYKSIATSDIAKSGVAIATNLGIKYQNKNTNVGPDIYSGVYSAEELLQNKSLAKSQIITNNMLYLKEYYSLIHTDFKVLLENSSNKSATLEGIYSQLRLRHENTKNSINNLTAQQKILYDEMQRLNTEIEQIKQKISIDYKKVDTDAVNQDIDQLLTLRNNLTYFRTYYIFVSNFISEYNSLNNYNYNLSNILYTNRDIISKGSYLVIPNPSDKNTLKEYGLLFENNEFTQKLEAEKKALED